MQPTQNLATNDVFRNYFRGLCSKVEKINGGERSNGDAEFLLQARSNNNYKENTLQRMLHELINL
jgi:hypothetical protein